jgi:methyltransferase-like protein/2-polyprenyl-3-methyl-5-hydroxy-6-metoxy-1,4-benzoquinol methylase
MTASQTVYDEVLYPGQPLPQTHPDRLATLATLFGMAPAPVDRCRVLELGCGDGANLIPMALALPESRFVGIDLAGRPIAQGKELAETLGLKNLSLRQLDVLDLTPQFGQFDYIIAHGLYSWVPAQVRDRAMAVCRANLAPQGIAYISYNTFPGGHLRRMVREMMLFHVRHLTEPSERITQARAMVQFLAESQPRSEAYRSLLIEEQGLVETHRDGTLYHDDLAPVNEPVYFHEFAKHAAEHGLQYLAEADFFEMQDAGFPPATRDALRQLQEDRIGREQYLDFLKGRRFRQSLLCHRAVALRESLGPEHLGSFLVSSSAQPTSPEPDVRSDVEEEFRRTANARVKTNHPLTKAALLTLGREWPRRLALPELLAQARTAAGREGGDAEVDAADLRDALFQTYSAGLVHLHVYDPRFAQPGERPTTSPLARLQAQTGALVTTLAHTPVRIDDSMGRYLIELLDGTRDREALLRDLTRAVESGAVPLPQSGQPASPPADVRQVLAGQLEPSLRGLARLGLLIA